MSSVQHFRDIGVVLGLLGRYDAPDHDGNPDNVHTMLNLNLISTVCGGGCSVVLSEQYEPRRILTLADSIPLSHCTRRSIPSDRVITTSAAGIFLTRASMEMSGITTICMPVCDHATVGVQVVDESGRVMAAAMLRVTPERASGDEGEIAALFEILLDQSAAWREWVSDIHFHLSAGRGPCCMPHATRRPVGDTEFDSDRVDESVHGLDMLELIRADVEERMREWNRPVLCSGASGRLHNYMIHMRDTACTVCCAEHSGTPYFNKDDGASNLAFFHTELKIPLGPVWKT